MSYIVAVVWVGVAIGMAIGRIMEKPPGEDPEVFSSHPDIEREQLMLWGLQFFDRPALPKTPSSTEFLQTFPRFPSAPRGLQDTLSRGGNRVNGRHYELEEGVKVKAENLEWMLHNVFMYPRNHNTNESAKDAAKKYIVDSLQLTSGLDTSLQHFQPIQFLGLYEDSTIPTGTNIIGILKGKEWGTPNDRPVLVGAHWDTVNFTPGTDDNGSGVASMLEVARVIAHSNCTPKHSLIFVAFDLEEVGSQGSLVFIKDYLTQILSTNFPHDLPLARFQGAFIMDTIMDFNDTEDSQTFPRDWSLLLPEVYDQVADNGYKGDFLSLIYRKGVDNSLADRFSLHWAKSSHPTSFRLLPFPLNLGKELPDIEILADNINFLRSDHSRFWYMNDTKVPLSLKAVLMTDTGPYRGNMRGCYHTVCDGPEVSVFNNPTNLKFLTKITQVMTETLMDMSECSSSLYPHSSHNFIKTPHVHAKSSSHRQGSPLRNLFSFVRWMEGSYS